MKDNFKFKVLDASGDWGDCIIVDKIYQVKDGIFKDESGFIWDQNDTLKKLKKNFDYSPFWLKIEEVK